MTLTGSIFVSKIKGKLLHHFSVFLLILLYVLQLQCPLKLKASVVFMLNKLNLSYLGILIN